MKLQRRSLAREIKAHRPLLFNQSGVSPSICSKMHSQQLNDYTNVESYIRLRTMKCDKSISLLNCSKQICRIDESITQVKLNNQAIIKNLNETRIIARKVLKDCIQKNKYKFENTDDSFKHFYILEDQSSQQQQSFINKHIDDSIQFKESNSFNLFKLSRQQLYIKLKNLNKSLNSKKILEEHNPKSLNLMEITQRSTIEPSINDISPLTISEELDNKKIKDKLKLLVSPQNIEQYPRKKQVTLPYFSKQSLNIKLNSINDMNQDSSNLTSAQTNNINSIMRNKSYIYSRELKKIHIDRES